MSFCVAMKKKQKALKKAYSWTINNFSSEKYNWVLRFFKLFYASDESLMAKRQFAQCTLQNRILAKLLIESGQFSEKDIEKKWFPFWGLHQYLIVDVGGKKIKVDPFFRVMRGMSG